MNDINNSHSLENQFLIAMPQLADSYFSNTVTYLWKHSSDGALGIVINKPLGACIADIFEELEIECNIEKGPFRERQVLAGGPIEKGKGFILHDAGESWESSFSISAGISICTSKSILQDMAAGNGPENYLIALGCAGWEAGQLEAEISANAWLTVPANKDLIFSQEYDKKTQQAADLLGVNLQQLSPDAGHS